MKMKVYHNRDGALVLTERTVNIKPVKSKVVNAAVVLFFTISIVSFVYVIKLLLGS